MIQSKIYLTAVLALSISITYLPAMAASPQKDANAGASVKGQANSWPKWFYYDQLGLREWNKGERPRAKQYFEQAFRIASSSLHGQPKDPVTARRLKEFIKHQTFLISYFEPIPPNSHGPNVTQHEILARTHEKQIEDTNDKLRFIDRLISFSDSVLGKTNYQSQDLKKQKNLFRMRVVQLKRDVESLRGWPHGSYDNGGRYSPSGPIVEKSDEKKFKAPKWYSGSTSDSWNKKKTVETQRSSSASSARTAPNVKTPDWYSRKENNNSKVYNREFKEEKGTMYVGGKPLPRSQQPQLPRQGLIPEGEGPREWGHNPRQFNKNRSTSLWGQSQQKSQLDLNQRDKAVPWGQNNKPRSKEYQGWGNGGWTDPSTRKIPGTDKSRDTQKLKDSVEWK